MSKSDYLENKDGRRSPYQVVTDGEKLCSRCQEWLSVEVFPPTLNRPSGYEAACYTCRSRYPSQSKERRNESGRRHWRTKGRAAFMERTYGITAEQYAEMVARQNGRCALCDGAPDARGLVVDHCHETDAVRGLLCDGCNKGLGFFRDDPQALEAAISYLRRTAP